MDLRKALLLKKPLNDSSCSSLNNSNASVYESAAEDSDSSLYYSFNNSSIKDTTMENSIKSNDQTDPDNSITSVSSEADKENTVIMNDVEMNRHNETFGDDISMEMEIDAAILEKETLEVIQKENDEVQEETPKDNTDHIEIEQNIVIQPEPEQKIEDAPEENIVEDQKKEEEIEEAVVEYPVPPVEIIIEDPNENIINPFTFATVSGTPDQVQNFEAVDSEAVKDILANKKKSATKIPMKTHLYSPLQRKSIDKKSKIIAKSLPRRTIYETRSQTSIKTKIPSTASVGIVKPTIKAKFYKCTTTGCRREFTTQKLLQDHEKIHSNQVQSSSGSASSSSSSNHNSSFKCKWCDKGFNVETALINHLSEKCTKIPFGERRKMLAEQDKQKKQNVDKRKTMIFAMPAPKKRSPRRQTMNKSNITITPKKTLKCTTHGCGKIFTDVLEFANHTVSHKYDKSSDGQS